MAIGLPGCSFSAVTMKSEEFNPAEIQYKPSACVYLDAQYYEMAQLKRVMISTAQQLDLFSKLIVQESPCRIDTELEISVLEKHITKAKESSGDWDWSVIFVPYLWIPMAVVLSGIAPITMEGTSYEFSITVFDRRNDVRKIYTFFENVKMFRWLLLFPIGIYQKITDEPYVSILEKLTMNIYARMAEDKFFAMPPI